MIRLMFHRNRETITERLQHFSYFRTNYLVRPFSTENIKLNDTGSDSSLKKKKLLIHISNEKGKLGPSKTFQMTENVKEDFKQSPSLYDKKVIVLNGRFITQGGKVEENVQVSWRKYYTQKISNKFVESFLPRDYPTSVKEGYWSFSKYMLLGNICLNASTFLSTQVLINSLGFSRNSSIAMSAGLNWVLKDSIGQLGGIVFQTKYAHAIEKNIKQMRILGQILIISAIYIEVFTIKFPEHFLLFASLAQIIKLISLVVGGVSRNGIIQHFAVNRYSFTDLQNKFFSQFNLALLIGNSLGLVFSILVPLNFTTALISITCLTTIQGYFTRKSLEQLALSDFNLQRMYIFASHYLKTGELLTHEAVQKKEKIFFFYRVKNLYFCEGSLDIYLKKETDNTYIVETLELFNHKRFCVFIKQNPVRKNKAVYTFMRIDAEGEDILKAFFFSLLVLEDLKNSKKTNLSSLEVRAMLQNNLQNLKNIDFKDLIKKLWDMYWNTHFLNLEDKYSRYQLIEELSDLDTNKQDPENPPKI